MKIKWGPYRSIRVVDITALQATITVFCAEDPYLRVTAGGSWWAVARVNVDFEGGVMALYSGRRGDVYVDRVDYSVMQRARRGRAIATFAQQSCVIQRGCAPFVREVKRSGLDMTMYVQPGTRIVY